MSQQQGSHRTSSSSLSAMVSTLVPCFVVAAVLVGAFFVLRAKQKRLYAPRTYHDALFEEEKTPSAGSSFFGWTSKFMHLSDEYVLNHHSLDAYLYMRFLKVLTLMAFVGAIITWPILFPVNATGGGGESGLDILSFSNIENDVRYFAHALVAWVFFGWVLFLIGREMLYLAKVRKAYLLSTWNASRISQRTVLFTDVPEKDLSLERLHTMFPEVAQIWLVPDVKDLEDDVEELEKTVPKLEASEIKYMAAVTKQQQKKSNEKNETDKALRPTHRLKPLIGHKVDSIGYYRNQIKELLPKIQTAQQSHLAGKEELASAIFIEFNTMAAAEAAFNDNQHRRPTSFSSRQMGVLPDEVIWKNLNMGSKNRMIRHFLATIAISALIIFWAIPVALVGIISNVNYLTANVPFLAWIDSIPPVILGVVTGLLPTVLLAVLMALVPVICRFFAKLAGAVTVSEVEQQCQTWYFAFQVIQVFLITTFTSSASAVASQIVSNPSSAITLLSKNLPKASNFYISYFILYGLANASRYLFNLMGLVGVLILSKFAKTPRKKYMRYVSFTEPSWGAEYPKWTNLGVIALSYACIAPLVLGFATIGIGCIYLAYRYNMIYVHDTHIDTKGGFYARALEQLMVGVYLGELCLLGLFGIGIGNSVVSAGPTVLQVVLIVATIIFHIIMKRKIKKMNLLDDSYHPSQRNDAEAGSNSEGNGMHPGYSNVGRNDSRQSESALVSTFSDEGRQHVGAEAVGMAPPSGAPQQRSMLKKIFSPHTASASEISSSLTTRFRHPVPAYTKQDVLEAYLHPALAQREEVIWLARDQAGISKNQVSELTESLGSYGVGVTDEGAVMNEKGKVEWDDNSVRQAPLWDHKVVY
ncbi:putative membrane protein [Alternaria alternata]|uniref:Putative membrane protein n=1 Tax=Alternaria alternata TaxID=5599 RepID=A0A4Q4NAV8_ALTAL|nr:putative membrane protein [Alternaria tenuissima]RYN73217.1 putative membrane protein [Alternaria alternata]